MIIEILSVILLVLGVVWGFYKVIELINKRRQQLKSLYKVIWKKASSEKFRVEILGERPFYDFYYKREFDKTVREIINNEGNLLIIGKPLAGKSRTVYQTLTTLSKSFSIIIPNCKKIDIKSFSIPLHLKFWKNKILLIDDIQRFVEQENFEYLIHKFLHEKNLIIIACCRSGFEYEKVKNKMSERNIYLDAIFNKNIVEIADLSEDEGNKITLQIGKSYDEVEFDKTIGSLFIPLNEMRRRYSKIDTIEKNILRAIKMLYLSNIYLEKHTFSNDWVKSVCKENFGIKGERYEWTKWFENLKNKEFIKSLQKNEIIVEEIYLEKVIGIETEYTHLEVLQDMFSTFSCDPDALFLLGNRACDIGMIEYERIKYCELAIDSYEKVLKVYTLDNNPKSYAITQVNLGNAYGTLGEVQNRIYNYNKSIIAFEKALKYFTIDQSPIDFAIVKYNLANTYRMLAEVDNKVKNCIKSIKACKAVLNVGIIDSSSLKYIDVLTVLGNAYYTLSHVENRIDNCKKSIGIFDEVLKVIDCENYPNEYANVQNNIGNSYLAISNFLIIDAYKYCNLAINACLESYRIYYLMHSSIDCAKLLLNLGNAYLRLADMESYAFNCQKAILLYEKSLTLKTYKHSPIDYAMTLFNLGNAYGKLARGTYEIDYCYKAIKFYNESLKVRTLKSLPLDYATTMNNLGNTYVVLAEAKNDEDNCWDAINAFKGALKVRTIKNNRFDYSITNYNLGIAYYILANIYKDVEKKIKYYNNSISVFKEALKIQSPESIPMDYAKTQYNLGIVYGKFAEISDTINNCSKAISALNKALNIYQLNYFPIDYAKTQHNLGNIYRILSEKEKKVEHFNKAISAFKESIRVRTPDKFPEEYSLDKSNLGNIYRMLAELDNKVDNCKNAILAYKDALYILSKNPSSQLYKIVEHNLRNALEFCRDG